MKPIFSIKVRTLRHWFWGWSGWHLSRDVVDTDIGDIVIWQVGPYRSLNWKTSREASRWAAALTPRDPDGP